MFTNAGEGRTEEAFVKSRFHANHLLLSLAALVQLLFSSRWIAVLSLSLQANGAGRKEETCFYHPHPSAEASLSAPA